MAKKKDDLIRRSLLVGELLHRKRGLERVFTRGELLKDPEYALVRKLLAWAETALSAAAAPPPADVDLDHRLLVVEGDVEPFVLDKRFRRRFDVLRAARAHRAEDPNRDDGVYHLVVDWKRRKLSVGTFSGGEMDGPRRKDHGKNNG